MPPPPPDNATIAAGALRRRANREPSPRITPSDGELLGVFARDARANEAAFTQLVERHGPMVWRVCRQVLKHQQDAEDAFQATFLILARRASAIRSSESAAGWLYRVAHRTAIAARRQARKRKESRMETEPLAPEVAFPDLAGRETAGVMMEELSALPTRYRTPLVLRYLEGRSRREIADQTDSTIAAVQGQLARGKAMLRGRLLRRGVSLSAAMAIVAGGSTAHANDTAPVQLIAQTTSNATAIATGGSVAASTAVVLLYREGVRAMFFAEVMKPVAVVAVALLLASGMAIGAGENDQPVDKTETLALDAVAPSEPESRAERNADGATIEFIEIDAEPNAKGNVEFTDTLNIKTWKRNTNGLAVDWQTGDHLTNTELEKRIRKFYANSPQTVGLGSPLIEAELRSWSWSVRSQHARRAVTNLQKQFENREIEVTDEQIRRLNELQSEADLALANAIKYKRELRRQLAAEQPAEAANSSPTPEPANRPTPLNGPTEGYWPSGNKKSMRQYRDGRVIAAIEYAEDGQVLYRMQDNSTAPQLKAAKGDAPQQPPNEFRLAPSDQLEVAMWDSEGENVLSGIFVSER